jgi:hypothetical protein
MIAQCHLITAAPQTCNRFLDAELVLKSLCPIDRWQKLHIFTRTDGREIRISECWLQSFWRIAFEQTGDNSLSLIKTR